MANFLLEDNTVKLATPRRSDGRVGRLRVEWNTRRGAMGLAGITQGGEWINAYLMVGEFVSMLNDIRQLINSKEETVIECAVDEGKDPQFAFSVSVGRDADGILFLDLGSNTNQTLRYLFMPERQYRKSINGRPMTPNELSRRKAAAWISVMERVVYEECKAGKEAYNPNNQKKQYNNNNNYGGGQKKQYNNNYGGGQKKQYNNNNNYQQHQSAPVADGNLDDYLTI